MRMGTTVIMPRPHHAVSYDNIIFVGSGLCFKNYMVKSYICSLFTNTVKDTCIYISCLTCILFCNQQDDDQCPSSGDSNSNCEPSSISSTPPKSELSQDAGNMLTTVQTRPQHLLSFPCVVYKQSKALYVHVHVHVCLL